MPNHFILIDFENVQPTDVSLLKAGQAQVKVFVGPHQSKIPVTLAASLQRLGPNVEYVVLETPGKNALDFQVAYHLGHLSAANPAASFEIISKDAGFDPLIKHLTGQGVRIRRSDSVDVPKPAGVPKAVEVPSSADVPKPAGVRKPAASPKAVDGQKSAGHLDRAIDFLKRRKASRPATTKTLLSSLRAYFKELSERDLAALVTSLQKRKVVQLAGDKITYRFPSEAKARDRRFCPGGGVAGAMLDVEES